MVRALLLLLLMPVSRAHAQLDPNAIGPGDTAPAAMPPMPAPVNLTLNLRVHMAVVGGRDVQTAEWLAAQVDAANEAYAPIGLRFLIGEQLTSAHLAGLETRRDRHSLSDFVDGDGIDVFIVESMRDVDDSTRMLRGVHWRGRAGKTYLILTSIAGPRTLAHELGHFFGNPHRWTPGNYMSYSLGENPHFDPDQFVRVVRRLRRFRLLSTRRVSV